MPYERTIEIGIGEGVLVRLSQSGRPIERYSVVLMTYVDGAWETIRVYDNHDDRVMDELAKSKNTPSTDAAFDLLGRVAVDPESDGRYPSGTVLIPADSPDASKLMSRAINERKPMAIVFPDGSDVVARPPSATGAVLLAVLGLLWLADHLRRKRDRPTFVPREWVTEFHAAGSAGATRVAA